MLRRHLQAEVGLPLTDPRILKLIHTGDLLLSGCSQVGIAWQRNEGTLYVWTKFTAVPFQEFVVDGCVTVRPLLAPEMVLEQLERVLNVEIHQNHIPDVICRVFEDVQWSGVIRGASMHDRATIYQLAPAAAVVHVYERSGVLSRVRGLDPLEYTPEACMQHGQLEHDLAAGCRLGQEVYLVTPPDAQ